MGTHVIGPHACYMRATHAGGHVCAQICVYACVPHACCMRATYVTRMWHACGPRHSWNMKNVVHLVCC